MQSEDNSNTSKPMDITPSPSYSPERVHSPTQDYAHSPPVPSPLNPNASFILQRTDSYGSAHDSGSASPALGASSASGSASPHHLKRRPSQLSQFVGYTPSMAETRLVETRQDTVELSSLLGPDDRLRFFRCLDNDMFPALIAPAERTKAVKTLDTLNTLLENALTKGLGENGDPKYLQVKLTNPAIRTKLDLDGKASTKRGAPSLEYLHLCGWRHKVQDFQEYLHFPQDPSPKTLAELRTGHRILKERLVKEQELAARTAERQTSAKEDEANRVKRTLAQIKEDREKVREISEREKIVRAAQASRSPTSPDSSSRTLPLSPRQSVPEDAMKED